jgi:FkbM family methyltransferase
VTIDAHRRLDAILTAASAHVPEEVAWLGGGSPIVIFGAGTLGREVAAKLRTAGRRAEAFIDETPGRAGQMVDETPVLDLPGALASYATSAVVVVAVWNPAHRFVSSRVRLRRAGFTRVASFVHLAYAWPTAFLPHYAFDVRDATLSRARELHEALDTFADEQSRDEFVRHVRFRMTLDFDALPPNSPEKYFRAEFAAALDQETSLIDCGAFNGDTVRDFIGATGGAFRSVTAVEPHPDNFAELSAAVAALGPGVRERVRLIQAAVAERTGSARMRLVPGQGSFLDDNAGVSVPTTSLDDLAAHVDGPLFVKFDIEGAEQSALRGGTALLSRQPRPSLAISVYHTVDDLWAIPLSLSHCGGYENYLRTEGDDGMGIVCYAFAEKRVGRDESA